METRSPRRFLGALAVVFITVGLLLVFALAVASVVYVTDGDGGGREVSVEAANGSSTSDSSPLSPPFVVNDVGLGSLVCQRSGASEVDPPPFVVSVSDVAADPDPLAVEVRLTDRGGEASSRVVAFGVVASPSASVQEAVPDSFDSGFQNCSVTAIQRGTRVLITGP